jgi:Zn ribbon nucleic-acid-binding protein
MPELVFEVTQEADGGYCAECLTADIFTEANTWDELRANVREAVKAYFFDQPEPVSIRLHLVKDEMILRIGSARVWDTGA